MKLLTINLLAISSIDPSAQERTIPHPKYNLKLTEIPYELSRVNNKTKTKFIINKTLHEPPTMTSKPDGTLTTQIDHQTFLTDVCLSRSQLSALIWDSNLLRGSHIMKSSLA